MANQSDSMTEGLKKLLGQLSQLMVLPDADQDFLSKVQQVIVGYIQQKAGQAAGMGQQQAAMAPGGAGGAGGQPGMAPPAPQQIAPGGGAGMSGFGMPNPDELRRVLSAGGGIT